MKRLNRLLLLSFLGILGGLAASGQALTSIRIGTNEEGARFLVDGQQFLYTQNFVWPEGSRHIVEFVQANDPGDPQPYQYHASGKARYIFNGWRGKWNGPGELELQPGPAQQITASRYLTELTGTVVKQFPVDIEFQYPSPAGQGCDTQVEVHNVDRRGVLLVDGQCFARNGVKWMTPGIHNFQAVPHQGFYFQGMLFDNGFKPLPTFYQVEINSTTSVKAFFELTKRVRFSTSPPGLQILVDRTPVTPQVKFVPGVNDACMNDAIINSTIKLPMGIKPLCIGDYDFVPGSVHQIGSEPWQVQTGPNAPDGDYWVFDRFSNGLGQNGQYVTPSNVGVREEITALFIHGVRSSIDSNAVGLKIVIDDHDVRPLPYYGFVWAEGSTHHLAPPELQRDAKGRMWRFVSWSDGGPREHTVTVPTTGGDFRIGATFELLGQVQVTSTPPGLTVKVGGADCTTPCTFDQDAGTTLNVEAPQNVAFGESSRYVFDAWSGRSATLAQTATFDTSVQVYNAHFHGAHRLLAYSDPEEGAKFKFSPESTDGFFAEGTEVSVTVVPNTGFKFIIWDQDFTSKSTTERLTLVGPSVVVAKMEKVPQIAPAGIRNAAGETPDGTVAPGSIISIYGANLADTLEIGPQNPLAQAIGNIYITVNNSLLPLIFVSPTQINAQLLSTLGDGDYTLTIHNVGKPDISGTFKVKRNAPGVFYNVTESGMPLVAALHQDGTPITPESPARKGETISFFGTGLGSYDRPIIDGFLLPGTEVYNLLDPVKVLAGIPTSSPAGANAAEVPPVVRDPAFAGGAAGMVGTNLIKVTIDPDLPPGDILELSILVNGSQSNKVQLPVQ